jgi:hypothetical protein
VGKRAVGEETDRGEREPLGGKFIEEREKRE